jgi:hypothetical protein
LYFLTGIKFDIDQALQDCTSVDSGIKKLVEIWKQQGLEGEPTLENSRKIAKKRENARIEYESTALYLETIFHKGKKNERSQQLRRIEKEVAI